MFLAIMYVRLDTHCHHLGYWYAELSRAPFDFATENPVGFRRLTPTISCLLGLSGRLIVVTNLLFAAALLFAVARYFVTRSERLVDTAMAVAAMTFSLVTLTTIHCGGYTDSATYLLTFLMWWFRRRGALYYSLFLLCLLNRESIIFLLPWLVFVRAQAVDFRWRWLPETVIGFALPIAAYLGYRDWIAQHTEVIFTLDYYVSQFLADPLTVFRTTFYYHGLGAFSVFKLLWIFPLLAVGLHIRHREWPPLVSFGLLLVGAYTQLFFAIDTSRMMTMAFMIMPISLIYLLRDNKLNVRRWAGWILWANLAVPTLYTAENIIEIWQPQWRTWLLQLMKLSG